MDGDTRTFIHSDNNALMVHSHLRFGQLLREPELIVE